MFFEIYNPNKNNAEYMNEKELKIMVQISVWNETDIDTFSNETKEKVSNAIKEYIINNWEECVSIEKSIQNNIYYVNFKIEL